MGATTQRSLVSICRAHVPRTPSKVSMRHPSLHDLRTTSSRLSTLSLRISPSVHAIFNSPRAQTAILTLNLDRRECTVDVLLGRATRSACHNPNTAKHDHVGSGAPPWLDHVFRLFVSRVPQGSYHEVRHSSVANILFLVDVCKR